MAAPDSEQALTWSAIRARLAADHPWIVSALFRAVPVHLPDGLDGPAATTDRWGRVYLNFDVATTRGVPELADAVRAAVLDWVSGQATEQPWHAHRLDARFAAVGAAQADRAGRTAAAGLLANPAKSYERDPLQTWREWAQRVAGPPQVTWQQHLGAAFRAAVSTRSGFHLRSYARPSRRQLPGVLLPSTRGPQINVAVLADISGSVATDLPTVLAEVRRIAEAAGLSGGTVVVYSVDDEVAEVRELYPNSTLDLTFAPREGHLTDLRPGFAAAQNAARRADVVIALTDGLTPWPDARPDAEAIVALIGPGTVTAKAAAAVPAWATTLHITT